MQQQAQSADDPERPLALRFRSGAVVGDPDAHLEPVDPLSRI